MLSIQNYFKEHQKSIQNIYELHSVISNYLEPYLDNLDIIEITDCCVEQSYMGSYSDCSFAIMMETKHIIVCEPSYTSFGRLISHTNAFAYLIYVNDYNTKPIHLPIYNMSDLIDLLIINDKKIEIIKMGLVSDAMESVQETPCLRPLVAEKEPPYLDLNKQDTEKVCFICTEYEELIENKQYKDAQQLGKCGTCPLIS